MLCAHHWLKHCKPNGLKEEFNTYYESLGSETKAVCIVQFLIALQLTVPYTVCTEIQRQSGKTGVLYIHFGHLT